MKKLTKVKRKFDIFVTKFIKINKKDKKQNHFIPNIKRGQNRRLGGNWQNIHKIFTEKAQFPLDFLPGMGYAMLALRQKEC